MPALLRGDGTASGLPIDDLPALIEPVAELAGGRRPQRRRFLAPVVPADRIARPRRLKQPDVPQLVEPVAEPAQPETIVEPTAPQIARRRRFRHWLAFARGFAPVSRRRRLAVAGAALLAILLAAYAAGIGPFASATRYPVAGAPSDPARRFAYFQKGAQAGEPQAQLQLAILYAKGEGVAQDYATAATWFRAAANQGLARAQYDMGVLTERGRGVQVDLGEAARWYLKAAQAGYPLAQYNLAVCYTRGQGIRQDFTEASLWYRRAATQGVVQAMINLALMYEKGEGVAASPVDAYAWYLAASRRDSQVAAKRADELFAGLPHLEQIRAEALASDVAASIHDTARDDNPESSGTSAR